MSETPVIVPESFDTREDAIGSAQLILNLLDVGHPRVLVDLASIEEVDPVAAVAFADALCLENRWIHKGQRVDLVNVANCAGWTHLRENLRRYQFEQDLACIGGMMTGRAGLRNPTAAAVRLRERRAAEKAAAERARKEGGA